MKTPILRKNSHNFGVVPDDTAGSVVADADQYQSSDARRLSSDEDAIPWTTYLLLATNVLVFLAMLRAGHGDVGAVASKFGDKDNQWISAGQWWRLITACFLHGGIVHLAVNSLSLYVFGLQMERIYGARKYFLIYMISGICGYVLSYWRSDSSSLGASGAIFGLVGAGLIFPLRYRRLIPIKARHQILSQLLLITFINLGLGAADPQIDNFAHVGGLLGGGAMALILMPEVLLPYGRRAAAEAGLSAAAAAMVILCCWAGAKQWQWATHDGMSRSTLVAPAGADPWWSARTPLSWRRVAPTVWQTSLGGVVRVSDSSETIRLGVASSLFSRADKESSIVIVDGKPGRRMVAMLPSGMLDMVVIEPYSACFMVLTLQCPAAGFAALDPEFLQLLQTVRFVHRPRPLASLPGQAPVFIR